MGKARPRCASTGRAALADLGLSARLLPLSDRELPLQHVDDLPVERAVLVCCELLKSLVERERHPQGDLLEIAPRAPLRTSLIGHRSTLPARCCSIAWPTGLVHVYELSLSRGMRRCIIGLACPRRRSAVVTYLSFGAAAKCCHGDAVSAAGGRRA